MRTLISISPAIFAQIFRRFLTQVEIDQRGFGPFKSFQSGLACWMEQYKEWLYFEARRRLNIEAWKKNWIGTGAIVTLVVDAIEIHEDKNYRNNIVEWQGKKGPDSISHGKLLAARKDWRQWQNTERVLWDMYVEKNAPEKCFEELVELFGGRYDLISYLFFIRDWNEFMPVKSSFFPEVFELLGVPHPMVKQCNWQNYDGVMARLREVQRHLQGYGLPNGVRLIDAHSFCWMLRALPAPKATKAVIPEIRPWKPSTGNAPLRGAGGAISQSELEEIQTHQKRIGATAQAIVVEAERERLRKAGRKDLSEQVTDVSDNLSLGYDIASFTKDGGPKFIEVKAAAKRGAYGCRFFLSENERINALKRPDYYFVLVFDVESSAPSLREFAGNELPSYALHPMQYEVRLSNVLE